MHKERRSREQAWCSPFVTSGENLKEGTQDAVLGGPGDIVRHGAETCTNAGLDDAADSV